MITHTFHEVETPPFFVQLESWINISSQDLFSKINDIQYIYCSDEFLLGINKSALNHDYYTDIITFDLRDNNSHALEAEIYISLDRVKENAQQYNCTFAHELSRVMIHGLLHLSGLNDSTKEEKSIMRKAEEKYINRK